MAVDPVRTRYRILMTSRAESPAEVRYVTSRADDVAYHGGAGTPTTFKRRSAADAESHRARIARKNPGWCYTIEEVGGSGE